MKLIEKVKELSKSFKEQKLDSIASVKKAVLVLESITSKADIKPDATSALAILAITHGQDKVESGLDKGLLGNILKEALVGRISEIKGQLFSSYSQGVNNYIKNIVMGNGSWTEKELKELAHIINTPDSEVETLLLNYKLAEVEIRNEKENLANLFALLSLSLKPTEYGYFAETQRELMGTYSIEESVNVIKKSRLDKIQKVLPTTKALNKTKFLKKLSGKVKKQLVTIDFESSNPLFAIQKVTEQNSKYLITDTVKFLLNNTAGSEIKFYEDRIEETVGGILKKVGFITKPIGVMESLGLIEKKPITNTEMRDFEKHTEEVANAETRISEAN